MRTSIVMASRQAVEAWMRGLSHAEVIVGEARFVAPATLMVNGRQLSAPRIFINVGGRSVRPDLQGVDEVPTLDNVSIMELATVPDHLVIGPDARGDGFLRNEAVREMWGSAAGKSRRPKQLEKRDCGEDMARVSFPSPSGGQRVPR